MSAGEEQDVIIAGGGTSGVATALCAKENITPRMLAADVSELQRILISQGVILTGIH